ncbi:MAG: hypothetical protein JWQ71_2781 [Pedosphaera sp.]|nr:hypothetical protein [Pedosphaera sp.]
MLSIKILPVIVASMVLVTSVTRAEEKDSTAVSTKSEKSEKKESKSQTSETPKAVKQKQGEAASKTAKFGSITKTDEVYKTAFDAHELENGHQNKDKAGAFKGTVSGVFEPKGYTRIILNFDPDYKSAMTALVNSDNFAKFPEIKKLVGKEVVVTGKFVDYQGNTEIIVTSPEQIKIVEGSESKSDKKE